MKPRGYQEDVLRQLEGAGWTGLLGMDLGTGKTPTAVWAAQRAGVEDGIVLIVGPLRTLPGWERTVQEITGKTVRALGSTKAGKAAEEALLSREPGWYFVGWEYMCARNYTRGFNKYTRKTGRVSVKNVYGGVVVDMLIADEVHRACNRKTLSWDVLTHIKARHRLGLSATPAGNKPENIYGALSYLWPNRWGSFTQFADRYFTSAPNKYSTSGFGKIYGAEKKPGLVKSMCPAFVTVKAEDVLEDLPEVQIHRVGCPMTREQKRVYTSWKEKGVAWLDGHPSAADIPATIDLRLRQATLGEPTIVVHEDGSEELTFDKECKSGKIDALLDILKDVGEEPVVVYTHSRKFLGPLLHRIAKAGFTVTAESSDHHGWEQFRDGEFQVLCAVIPAVAEGVDGLQHRARTEVWLSQDNSLILNQQAIGRLHRSGQTRGVVRYLLQCPGTIDDTVFGRLQDRFDSLKSSGLI